MGATIKFKCNKCELGPCYLACPTESVRQSEIVYELDSIQPPDRCPFAVDETQGVYCDFKILRQPAGQALDDLIEWGAGQDNLPEFAVDALNGEGAINSLCRRSDWHVWRAVCDYSIGDMSRDELNDVLKKHTKTQLADTLCYYAFLAGLLFGERMRRDDDYKERYSPKSSHAEW